MTHENDTALWYSTSPSALFHRRVSRAKRVEYTGKWIAVSKLMHNDGICRRERLSEKVASGQINATDNDKGHESPKIGIQPRFHRWKIFYDVKPCMIKELEIIQVYYQKVGLFLFLF